MESKINEFINEKINVDTITGGANGTATGDTCSNNKPDDCDVVKQEPIVLGPIV